MATRLQYPEHAESNLINVAKSHRTFSENEARKIIEWAQSVNLNYSMLHDILSGRRSYKLVNGRLELR